MFRHAVIPLILLGLFPARPAAQTLVAPAQQRPSGSTRRPAEDPLQEIEALLQKGRLEEAEDKLRAILHDQAKNPQAWFDLGYIQSQRGKTQDAITSYKKAVELQPDWFEASLNLGVDLEKAGNTSEAIGVLNHAVELKPAAGGDRALARGWVSLGRALASTDAHRAAAAFDKAAELNPGDIRAGVEAGQLLEKSGDLPSAEQHYVKAATSGDAEGMAKLIDLLDRQKRFADAEGWLRKYIQQKPQDYSAVGLLGHSLLAQGKRKEAIELLEANAGPGRAAINSELAEAYIDDKQYTAAIPLLQAQTQERPSAPALHMRLGYALLHELKYSEAESELLKAVQLKPDLAEAYGYLADAARQNKHYELCIRALDARMKLLPETPGTYFLRATAYDELHMTKPAVANYKQFLAAAEGKYPDQEFQARHRLKALEH